MNFSHVSFFILDAILGFAGDTKTFTTGSEGFDAIFLLIIMTPFLFLPNYESLAKVSALGTGLIFVIFIVFGGYGLHTNGLEGFHSLSKNNLWPQSFEAFSNWFGVAVCKFRHLIMILPATLRNSISQCLF